MKLTKPNKPMISVSPSKTTLNTPKIGDILLRKTGYEASIAYWAQVVGVTGKRVKFRELEQSCVYAQGGMEWTSTVKRDCFVGDVITKAFCDYGTQYRVKCDSYSNYYFYSGDGTVECYNHH